MTEMNKILKIMHAVMAALRTFGIEFDTNVSGFDTNKETKKEHVVKYNMFDKQPLEYLKGFQGKYWQLWDNREGVWIELHKLTPPDGGAGAGLGKFLRLLVVYRSSIRHRRYAVARGSHNFRDPVRAS